ncbi:hypothetical protein GM418_04335 [Maribellus comscasis]|uniref:Adhesin domain-containing protein n=1 Tax=Maribellus comscasis TaxID=2681766 RepID=A0A6I6JPH2_9BACT|nr:hypothetical protein [Maribellus comscasis]QGY42910.1 hypothetical protein GM418_04335 [Maribellus comscasis]
MKSKFKFFTILFALGIFSTGLKAFAEEKTKEYHQAWTVNSVQTMEISNKYGEIKINSFGGDSITIDVVITVEAPNEKRANELLEQINIDFGKSGSTASAVTELDNNFKSRQKFSIDYRVNIPSDKNLKVANKYGNTIVNELNADGDFNIQYGNFTANQLNAPVSGGDMNLNLAYGKADIGSSNDMGIEVKYSTINLGGAGNLKVESKYSVLNVEESKVVNIESKYDTFEFEEIEALSATTKYSHFKIEELKKRLKIEAGYGGISVDEIADDFESISIENSYGQIKLGLDEASYSLDASCDYCGISYPEDDFVGNRMKENHSQTVKGKVGSGGSGTVYIRSRYGEIKLR